MAVTKILLGITGATGMLYVSSLLKQLGALDVEVHGIISDAGLQVLKFELQIAPDQLSGVTQWYSADDFSAAPASGSARFDAMVILPCTVGSLAAIASGYTANLIHRAADVTLKERRPLILAVRETPLNRTHLKNMLTVHDAGALICPPLPAFYSRPTSFEEMADNYTGRLCELLGLHAPKYNRWPGGTA
ncbi:MAG: aromatic acid decarboxylase [Desulfobulbus propionicus]|nr:MAG: aromatic acid decarboxylase [Desulfobulbus propionicus]PIE63555.1 MAG: aromatic acid decarboxylase [Desulfobacterales bacterium]